MANPGIRWSRWIAVATTVVVVTGLGHHRKAPEPESFEPPKYIASLIAAVNDGAKSAQLGALAFTAIGLFLLATAFAATDEDLLLNRALTISQLGSAAVPVVFAFGLAPIVFVAAHFYTLIRYDMLAGNVRRFLADLVVMVPTEGDRDRCRQLLANVEFVNWLTMPTGSRASSWMFRWAVRVLLAVFPVAVLLIVQLQSLRLQSEWVTWTHHLCLVADLVLLVWFFGRLLGEDSWHFWRAPFRRKVALCWLPAVVLTVDLLWLEVPGPNSRTVRQHLASYLSKYPGTSAPFMQQVGWGISFQPVDLLLCTPGAWGCRFLTVARRAIVAKVWDTGTFVAMRAGADVDQKHRASFDAASLRGRVLRFADLTESQLFGVDLIGADLRRASLSSAQLQGADLTNAKLSDADLTDVNLRGAKLDNANLSGAQLEGVVLEGASLFGIQLEGADLRDSTLRGVFLRDTDLTNTFLMNADLTGATLEGVRLYGDNLSGADLRGAYLPRATLRGKFDAIYLDGSNLNGADLREADIDQEDLDGACGRDAKLPPGLTLEPCGDEASHHPWHAK